MHCAFDLRSIYLHLAKDSSSALFVKCSPMLITVKKIEEISEITFLINMFSSCSDIIFGRYTLNIFNSSIFYSSWLRMRRGSCCSRPQSRTKCKVFIKKLTRFDRHLSTFYTLYRRVLKKHRDLAP